MFKNGAILTRSTLTEQNRPQRVQNDPVDEPYFGIVLAVSHTTQNSNRSKPAVLKIFTRVLAAITQGDNLIPRLSTLGHQMISFHLVQGLVHETAVPALTFISCAGHFSRAQYRLLELPHYLAGRILTVIYQSWRNLCFQ